MKIAVIGAGNVGGTLAKQLAKAGHTVYLGVRNVKDSEVKALISKKISAHSITEATYKANVIVTAAYPQHTKEIAKQFGDVSKEALLTWTNCKDVVRCFNTTGFENMANPNYKGKKIDMFVAGNSKKGKKVAIKLAKEIGFGQVYDLGGNDKFELMEQIVIVWRGLAEILGRKIALNILTR